MTNSEKEKVRALRINGFGYQTIAAELNISRDSIKSFCQRNGLGGFRATGTSNDSEKLRQFCKNCAKPIAQVSHGRARLFCSEGCRRTWWAENPNARAKKPDAVYKFTCAGCGSEFHCYGNKTRKYCGHACYTAHRWNQGEADEHTVQSEARQNLEVLRNSDITVTEADESLWRSLIDSVTVHNGRVAFSFRNGMKIEMEI